MYAEVPPILHSPSPSMGKHQTEPDSEEVQMESIVPLLFSNIKETNNKGSLTSSLTQRLGKACDSGRSPVSEEKSCHKSGQLLSLECD